MAPWTATWERWRIARPVRHRYGGDSDICLGNVQEMSAIEAAWEFARRVFLTAMSRLQCLYVERHIESLEGLSFSGRRKDAHLQDAAIRDVITTLYSRRRIRRSQKTVLKMELDREVARISRESGVDIPENASDDTGETVTVSEFGNSRRSAYAYRRQAPPIQERDLAGK